MYETTCSSCGEHYSVEGTAKDLNEIETHTNLCSNCQAEKEFWKQLDADMKE